MEEKGKDPEIWGQGPGAGGHAGTRHQGRGSKGFKGFESARGSGAGWMGAPQGLNPLPAHRCELLSASLTLCTGTLIAQIVDCLLTLITM